MGLSFVSNTSVQLQRETFNNFPQLFVFFQKVSTSLRLYLANIGSLQPRRTAAAPRRPPARQGTARHGGGGTRCRVLCCCCLGGWGEGAPHGEHPPAPPTHHHHPPTLRMFAGWCAGVCSRLCRIEKAPAWLSTSFATSMGGWVEGHHAPHHHHTWTKRAHIEVVSKPEIP